MINNIKDYRQRIQGCWMGKNIGGTLGAPFEFWRQVNNVSFYTQELGGEPLPNDDLDLQLLWLIALEEQGIDIDAHTLGEYWCLYITPHWSEYGIGKTNLRAGLLPPISGDFDNLWRDSCGAFIRSEIWACIAPGRPDVAAKYAVEDAIVDHGQGEGTWGEVFFAAMQSAAFICQDIHELINIGLSYIPTESGVAKAIQTAVKAHNDNLTWQDARDEILRHHRGSSLFNIPERTSEEDRQKGFDEGQLGYDVPSNVALTVYSLLYGGDDFAKVVCTAVNCGEDTDCTAATAGATFGLIHGYDAIPQKWIEPVGQTIKTMCLNLGELGAFGGQIPQTIDDLSKRTEQMANRVLAANIKKRESITLDLDNPDEIDTAPVKDLYATKFFADDLAHRAAVIRHKFDFFTVDVEIIDGPTIAEGQSKQIKLTIHNTGKIQAKLHLQWHTPDGWFVEPARSGTISTLPPILRGPEQKTFTLNAGLVDQGKTICTVSIAIDSRPTVMTLPVTFINGSFD